MVSMYDYIIWSISFGKNFFLPKAVFMYGLQHSEFALGKKKFLTWNSFYVWCMTFQVLLSERTNSSFQFPMQYCVGIVDIFLDSRVPNLHNPLPPFINVPNSSCHLQKIDNIQQLYKTMSRLIVVLGAIAQSLPLMPNTVISANGSNHMFPASDCPYIVTPPPYIPLAPPEPSTTSIYNPHQVPNNTQNPAPITKPLPTTLPTLTLPKVSMFLTFSLHTTQHPVYAHSSQQIAAALLCFAKNNYWQP